MTHLQKRRAISPLLATVILLGVTVAGGGTVFGFYSNTQDILSAAGDSISIQNINAEATPDHGILSFSVTNVGDKPWTTVSVNAIKGEVPARIFYMPLSDQGGLGNNQFVSSPVTVSAVTDMVTGDDNGGLIGYSNLMMYSTSETGFTPSIFTSGAEFWQPATLCADNTNDVAANFVATNLCAGTTMFTGIGLPAVIQPGDSINPSTLLFTQVPPNVVESAVNAIDTVVSGDELTLQVIVDYEDGTQATKTKTFTVR
ncbi:MAG: archaellin/type IV pilin N-terminal domain-containing protein [Nitrosopumilus sp.]